jgi:hypothetical protein
MNFNSLKEILLKKASNDSNLQKTINSMSDDTIIEHIIESLEKMSRAKGHFSNGAMETFANQMTGTDANMLHDALGHHLSHYQSALKNGNRDVANAHLNKMVPYMDLAAKAAPNSSVPLKFDHESIRPWEMNYTLPIKNENGKYRIQTDGLNQRANPNTNRDKNPHAVPDYKFLEMAPHEEHPKVHEKIASKGYPFENIQFGSPEDVDANKAYLDIKDVGKHEAFVPHPFDNHPIHEHMDKTKDQFLKLSDEKKKQFAQNMDSWHESPHVEKWIEGQSDEQSARIKPNHFYEGIKLQDQPHKKSTTQEQPKLATPPTPPSQPISTKATSPISLEDARKIHNKGVK